MAISKKSGALSFAATARCGMRIPFRQHEELAAQREGTLWQKIEMT
jgi:hypothetical protein